MSLVIRRAVFLPNGIERKMEFNPVTMRAKWVYGMAQGFPSVTKRARKFDPTTQQETEVSRGNYTINGEVIPVAGNHMALVFRPDAEYNNTIRVIMLYLEKNVDRDGDVVDMASVDYRNYHDKNHRFTKPVAKVCAKIMKDLAKAPWLYDPDYIYAAEHHAHYQFFREYYGNDELLPKFLTRKAAREATQGIVNVVDSIFENIGAQAPDIEIAAADPITRYGEMTRYLDKDFKMTYTDEDNFGYVRLFGTMLHGRNVEGSFIPA